ncbi:CNBP [Mytilus edulis]|uniref:CNBP n=1 Tax=Mytilus edulis TaxID=6550 RepID=A0A8S3Q0W8_MYTED|nr:CNBP [Mytilus edulis]
MPFEVKPAIVHKKISQYGKIIKLISPTFKNFPSIQSGVRIVRIASMEKPIPRKIYIQGQLVTIRYEGQQNLKKCYKCNEYGHIAIDCRNEPKRRWEQKDYCFKCGRYGHKSTECYNDKDVPNTNNTYDNGNSDQENLKTYDISQYDEVHDQNIDTHSKFCSFDTGTRYFGQGFPSPPKKDHIENTEEFVTSEIFDTNLESINQYQTENTTYKNNWENEESWEQDNQDDITNKQEIIQQNELQIGEIIEISCEHKEKTVETHETENVSVFTRNEQTFETEFENIVENVEIDTQIKENEQMENKNTEAKKKKDKTKVGKKKTEEKMEDKDKTKSSKTTHKKGEIHSDKTKKDEPKTDSKTTLANKRARNSTGDGKKQEHTQKKTKVQTPTTQTLK